VTITDIAPDPERFDPRHLLWIACACVGACVVLALLTRRWEREAYSARAAGLEALDQATQQHFRAQRETTWAESRLARSREQLEIAFEQNQKLAAAAAQTTTTTEAPNAGPQGAGPPGAQALAPGA